MLLNISLKENNCFPEIELFIISFTSKSGISGLSKASISSMLSSILSEYILEYSFKMSVYSSAKHILDKEISTINKTNITFFICIYTEKTIPFMIEIILYAIGRAMATMAIFPASSIFVAIAVSPASLHRSPPICVI